MYIVEELEVESNVYFRKLLCLDAYYSLRIHRMDKTTQRYDQPITVEYPVGI